ncbi:MAG: cysteine--tRNA ligase [Candidatus Colwellbacteria bacterium]|nr:cysteine--tRNA ligase [Candidatus Colwellbacteria bacterium]
MLSLYNTLSRKKEAFKPIKKAAVNFYACGPTVYDAQHIGNFRTYIFNDILRRTLKYNGYKVRQVINITDVGHLTSDADSGEDKIQAAARKKKKTAWQVARLFENQFKKDFRKLNLEPPYLFARATDHVKEQIVLIKKLEKKGYTYLIPSDGLYFDTARLRDYGKLAPSRLKGLRPGARVKIVQGKRNSTDFALWKFSSKSEKRDMEWDSPWGKGFPGWHIECSAMSMKYLGLTFDIHTGGIEHVPIHHTNEIAQSEAATGKKFVNYWVHGEHLLVNKKKMSKSLGNFYTLDDLEKKEFDPLSFRYLVLNAHYRSKLNFTWKGIASAASGVYALYHEVAFLKFLEKKNTNSKTQIPNKLQSVKLGDYSEQFIDAINDDLNTSKALAVVRDLIGSKEIRSKNKLALLFKFDEVLGLKLKEAVKFSRPPAKVRDLVKEREKYRVDKQFVQADRLRKRVEALGYTIEDTTYGPFVWQDKVKS